MVSTLDYTLLRGSVTPLPQCKGPEGIARRRDARGPGADAPRLQGKGYEVRVGGLGFRVDGSRFRV